MEPESYEHEGVTTASPDAAWSVSGVVGAVGAFDEIVAGAVVRTRPRHGVEAGDGAAGPLDAKATDAFARAVVANTSDLIWVLDSSGNFRWVGGSASRVLGYAPEHLIGRRVDDIIDAGHAQRALETFGVVLGTPGAHGPFEVRLRHRDGSCRDFEAVATNALDDPALGGVVVNARDVSSRRVMEEDLRRSREGLALAQRIARLGSWEWDIASGSVAWSDQVFRIFGCTPASFTPTFSAFLEMVHAEDREFVARSVDAAVNDRHPYSVHFRAVTPSGVERYIHAQGEVYFEGDTPVTMVGTIIDVSDQKRTLDALVASERFSRSVLDSMGAHTAVLDRDGTVVATNRAWRRFAVEHGGDESLGLGANYLAVAESAGPDDGAAREAAAGVRAVLRGEQASFTIDYACAGAAEERWYALTVQALATQAGGAVVSHDDVTDRKRAETALAYQALHDPLTGLPNRVLLVDRITQALARRARNRGVVAALFLDLDRFKVVNDSLGHAAGDEILVAAAAWLRSVVRPGDTVARFGGDEFVVLCEDLESAALTERVAGRVVDAFEAPFSIGGRNLYVSASVGVAIAGSPDVEAESLLRNADTAMYRAKELGRRCYALFDDTLRVQAVTRLDIEHDLRESLEHGELRVEYQPLYDLADRRVVGAEALLRWEHPARGAVSPNEFIPVAEETGLIVAVGAFALRAACERVAGWDAIGALGKDFEICVNLSARQLAEPGLLALVRSTLAETGLSPTRLCLEVTETAVMQDADAAVGILAALKRLGVRIALDDFGTGNASLSYLSRFSVDVLKIDRSFVAGLTHDCGDHAIVTSVVSMASGLGLAVVAEGVETEEQLAEVRRLGCRYAQGFLLAPPMPPEQVVRHLG